MRRVKYKKRVVFKISRLIFVVVLLIIINTIFFLMIFLNKFSPTIERSAKKELKEITTNLVLKHLTKEKLKEITIEELIIVNTNSNGEVSQLDFKLDRAYEVILDIKEELDLDVKKLKMGKLPYNTFAIKENLILKIPYYSWTNNLLLMNLGPKIYVQINLLENVRASVYSSVSNYGINSLLINLYVKLYIKESLLYPSTSEEIDYNFELLVATKVIQGRIPSLYNGVLEKTSEFLNVN